MGQLTEQFEKHITEIVRQVDGEVDPDRLRQFSLAVQHDNFYRGIQNIVPSLDKESGRILWTAADKNDGSEDDVRFRSINKVRGDGKKFISVLGAKAPNCKAMADDPQSEQDKSAARQADSAAELLRTQWDVEEKNNRLALAMWKYGPVFGYIRHVSDGDRYGYDEVPVLENKPTVIEPEHYKCPDCAYSSQTPQCESCGTPLNELNYVPAVVVDIATHTGGVEKYAKGQVELDLYSVLQVRVPFYSAPEIRPLPYLCLEYEESKAKLLSLYPELREKLKSGSGGIGQQVSEKAAISREQTISSTGYTGQRIGSKLTYTRYWLRPVMYELIDSDETREQLKQQFPLGLKATLISGHLVALEEEKLEDRWAYCASETTEYIYSDALCRDMIEYQKALNDSITLGMESLTRNLPLTIVDQSVLDARVLAARKQLPGDIIIAKPSPTTSIDKAVAVVPSSNFPKDLVPFTDSMQEHSREATGIQAQMFGGGPGGGTAEEYIRRSNAALAQLGMQWGYMRRFWVQCYTLGVREMAKFSSGDVKVTRKSDGSREVDTIDFDLLSNGSYHFECDEAIPQNWGQQRDQLTFLLGQAPQIAQELEVTSPANADAVRSLLGFPMLTSSGAELRDKVMEDIQQMLQSPPIPDPQTMQPMPTIEPDPLDDPSAVLQIVYSWLVDKPGRREKVRNQAGWENVHAYAMLLKQQLMPPPPPGSPDGANAPPPEGGGDAAPPPPSGPVEPPGAEPNPMLSGPMTGTVDQLAA
jgi:hypothetical protein